MSFHQNCLHLRLDTDLAFGKSGIVSKDLAKEVHLDKVTEKVVIEEA